jgi:multidrug efflux pump subunit AcrA (membrane-fusion protein)
MRMEAARTQALADQRFAEAQLANTVIRAPFTGVVVKKMAEVGESVAPIPPGVNLSTSSGAIVALADLDTLRWRWTSPKRMSRSCLHHSLRKSPSKRSPRRNTRQSCGRSFRLRTARKRPSP